MLQRSNEVALQMSDVLVETFTINDAINQLILEHLDRSPLAHLARRSSSMRADSQCPKSV
jgi:hypothetical protein